MDNKIEATIAGEFHPPLTGIVRTFRDLSDEEVADIERANMLASIGWSGGIEWPRLLESKRVLIISEAGAGKTFECRSEQQRLWDASLPSFFLDLAELARSNVRDMLSAEEEVRLDQWLSAQSEEAVFFLDSYDELKLSLGSFEQALKRLAKTIGGQLGRVRVVVTTRPIPLDQTLISQHLPVPETARLAPTADEFADIAMGDFKEPVKDKSAAPEWRNVALMPLSDSQIEAMAKAEGVPDTKALITSIRHRGAHDFARRPQDLIEICADWNAKHELRTHRDQVANNIAVKLKPRSDRKEKAALSPSKALEGASRLALAAALTRKLTFRHNVDADRAAAHETALDPADILFDWSPDERECLLERALFGFATYGRVRFHHRSVIDYLAAERLHEMMQRGAPVKSVKRLLFARTAQGIPVVRPSLRGVAGWLSSLDVGIFREVVLREPEVLLVYGDPQTLSVSHRSDALVQYVERYGRGGWRGLDTPRLQVERFAAPELTQAVLSLWAEGIENQEVRQLLLDMIGSAPMPEGSDIAYIQVMDGNLARYERIDALEALIALNDPRLGDVAASIETDIGLWPDDVAKPAIVRLFPQHLSAVRLCVILSRLSEKRRTVGDLGWTLPNVIENADLPIEALEEFRRGLDTILRGSLSYHKDFDHIRTSKPFLVPAFAAACLRLWRAGYIHDELINSIVLALRVEDTEHGSGRDEPVKELRLAVRGTSPDIRSKAFWSGDALMQNLHPTEDAWRRFFEASYQGAVQLDVQDAEWVIAALSDQTMPADRRTMMLRAAMHETWDRQGDKLTHVKNLKPSVADVPDLVAIIDEWLKPNPDLELEALEREERRLARREDDRRRKLKARASWLMFWKEIAEHPDRVFADDQAQNTAWNLWRTMDRTGDHSRESGWNRHFVEHHFGRETADRLRRALGAVWRAERPTMVSEREPSERNSYLTIWQVGLAGIAAEAEDGDWAKKLDAKAAALATRYSSIQLNGFPSWLESLIAAHPGPVDAVLGVELTYELNRPAEAGSHCMMLQDIGYAADAVVDFFVPRLLEWLESIGEDWGHNQDHAAANERMSRILRILLKRDDAAITERIKVAAVAHFNADTRALDETWLPVLLQLEPQVGLDAFENLLGGLPPDGDEAVGWFANMFGDRHGEATIYLKSDAFSPTMLFRLLRLAYVWVTKGKDIYHEGSYSPGSRDNAQTGRNNILSALFATTGEEAWKVKMALAEDPLFADFKDRAIVLAYENAALEVDEVLATEHVIALDRTGETPPSTPAAMFGLLRDRLDDFDDLLLTDVSPREAWAGIDDEHVMRREIARELRHRANDAYTVDQEAATADEKETDIRMRSTLPPQQAVIELKIGDKDRSGAVLRATIRDQLVKKYMAEEQSRAGALLITIATEKNWQHPDTKAVLDFAGLIAMLQEEADAVETEMGGTIRLLVKGLDLRQRLPTEKESKRRANPVPMPAT